MLGLTIGGAAGLLAIAVVAQWLLKKRAQHKGARVGLMWIAWGFAVAGGLALSVPWGSTAGITRTGAAVIAAVGIMVLVVDVLDKRPDWPAFACAALVPSFIAFAGGTSSVITEISHLVSSAVS